MSTIKLNKEDISILDTLISKYSIYDIKKYLKYKSKIIENDHEKIKANIIDWCKKMVKKTKSYYVIDFIDLEFIYISKSSETYESFPKRFITSFDRDEEFKEKLSDLIYNDKNFRIYSSKTKLNEEQILALNESIKKTIETQEFNYVEY